jgi:hypothetical protein
MPTTTTYRYSLNDCKLALKSAFPDAEIPSNQILFWVRIAENFIMQRHLKVDVTGAYLTEFNTVPVVTTTSPNLRKYVVLPASVLDLTNDTGIVYVAYQNNVLQNEQVFFQWCEADEIQTLDWMPLEAPSTSNPYAYRVGNNIYLLGVEALTIANVQIGMYAAVDPRTDYVNIDSPMAINEEQIISLRDIVLDLGKYMLMIPKERLQAGDDQRAENVGVQTLAKAGIQPNQQQQG